MTDDNAKLLLALGKAQVDAMFHRQEDYAVDDSEFLPLVEVVLNTFETVGSQGSRRASLGVRLRHLRQGVQGSRTHFDDSGEPATHAELPPGKTSQGPQTVRRPR